MLPPLSDDLIVILCDLERVWMACRSKSVKLSVLDLGLRAFMSLLTSLRKANRFALELGEGKKDDFFVMDVYPWVVGHLLAFCPGL